MPWWIFVHFCFPIASTSKHPKALTGKRPFLFDVKSTAHISLEDLGAEVSKLMCLDKLGIKGVTARYVVEDYSALEGFNFAN